MVGTKPIRSPTARQASMAWRSSHSVRATIIFRSSPVELGRLLDRPRGAAAVALLGRGEAAGADVVRVARDRFAGELAQLGVAPHEAGRDPLLRSQQVVVDEHLAGAAGAGADADGG